MKSKILFFVFIPAIFIGCKKEDPEPDPIACFTLSSTMVDINEVITIINCSTNAYSYLWNDGDGNQTAEEEPTLYYPEPGTYLVTLTAFSQSGNKQNVSQQSVTVIHMTGEISFWTATTDYGVITVSIGGYTDQITIAYPDGITACNMNGCANFTLPTGNYSVSATAGIHEWSGSVTVTANQCNTIQFQ